MALCGELQHVWAQKCGIRPNTRLWGCLSIPLLWGYLGISLGTADLLLSLCSCGCRRLWRAGASGEAVGKRRGLGAQRGQGQRRGSGTVWAGSASKDCSWEGPTAHPGAALRRGDKPCSTWGAACQQLLRGRRVSLCAVLRESPLLLVVGTVPERDLPSLWRGSNLRSQGLQEVKTLHCSDSKHSPRILSWAGVLKCVPS